MVEIPSDKHQNGIKFLINYWKGINVKTISAEIPGYSSSGKTKNHIPDARGIKEDINYIGEVKTEDDIDNDHSLEQYKEFGSRQMSESKKPVPFYLVVPKGNKNRALLALKKANIYGENTYILEY